MPAPKRPRSLPITASLLLPPWPPPTSSSQTSCSLPWHQYLTELQNPFYSAFKLTVLISIVTRHPSSYHLGGRLNGHLDIVITAAKYTSTTATEDLVIPVNPETAPIHSTTVTISKITNTIRLHGENDRDFQLYHYVKKSLCNQLIASTPRTFPKKL